jgi:3-hydroxy-9,10-secoandrosta-1,3,5(10)-triene-9,17-dione monooxygenase reductase component
VPDFDPETLRTVLRRFATGVAVVTTWSGEHPWGTTVNSFSSVSLRPPLVLVAFDRERRIVPAIRAAGRYAVNILGEEHQALSDCFAGGPTRLAASRKAPAGLRAPAGVGSAAEPEPSAEISPGRDGRPDFCGAEWRLGVTGLPILVDSIASLECTVVDVHPAGDHDLYVAQVDAATSTGDQPMPLLYYSGRYLRIERASSHELEGKPEG